MAPALDPCPSCGSVPSTPLVCQACGALLEPRTPPSPFEALGLEPAYAVDLAGARKRLLELSRALHPDFHGTADARTRRLAQENSAALNAAFQVLADDARRADWLVRSLGGPGEDEERAMPPAFLAEVLEWNETIQQARAAPGTAGAALEPLEERLRGERSAALRALAARLVPLPARGSPALSQARQRLNALRYLDRVLRELGELRLAEPRA